MGAVDRGSHMSTLGWSRVEDGSDRYKKRVTGSLKLDDQKALGVIGKSVKAEFAESIGQADSEAEAWSSLQQIYESNSAGSLFVCRSEFYKLAMGVKV